MSNQNANENASENLRTAVIVDFPSDLANRIIDDATAAAIADRGPQSFFINRGKAREEAYGRCGRAFRDGFNGESWDHAYDGAKADLDKQFAVAGKAADNVVAIRPGQRAEGGARAEAAQPDEGGAKKKTKKKRPMHPGRVRPNDNLPTITLTEADRKEAVDRSEAALIAADLGVYQRDGRIVGAAISKGRAHNGEETAFQHIAERGEHALVEDLSRSAHYQKWDSRMGDGGDYVQVSPPMWIVLTLRQRSEKHLPILGACPRNGGFWWRRLRESDSACL